jgi:NAD(P)-dependent dehydrogenase (short-subunit alcohol dehydrogenase family)
MTSSDMPEAALVTGAAARLGRAQALALAERGLAVAVHVNKSVADGEALVAEIVARGGRAAIVVGDLADPTMVDRIFDEALAAIGPVGVVVNNASLFDEDTAQDFKAEAFDRHMAVNLHAPVRLARRLAQSLPAGRHGLVVNLIDQRVWKLAPTFFTYTLSKSALWTATRTLAQALAPNVRVNAIGPGPTLRNARQGPDDFAAQCKATLLETGASPADIAHALCYLLEARAVTGQMIAVDAGQHLIWRTPDIEGIIE